MQSVTGALSMARTFSYSVGFLAEGVSGCLIAFATADAFRMVAQMVELAARGTSWIDSTKQDEELVRRSKEKFFQDEIRKARSALRELEEVLVKYDPSSPSAPPFNPDYISTQPNLYPYVYGNKLDVSDRDKLSGVKKTFTDRIAQLEQDLKQVQPKQDDLDKRHAVAKLVDRFGWAAVSGVAFVALGVGMKIIGKLLGDQGWINWLEKSFHSEIGASGMTRARTISLMGSNMFTGGGTVLSLLGAFAIQARLGEAAIWLMANVPAMASKGPMAVLRGEADEAPRFERQSWSDVGGAVRNCLIFLVMGYGLRQIAALAYNPDFVAKFEAITLSSAPV